MEKTWVKKTLFPLLAILILTFILVPMTGADTKKSYYVALGDSLTVGYQAPIKGNKAVYGRKFADLYFDQLKIHYQNIEALNYGKIGISSGKLKDDILRDQKLRERIKQADVITITIGGNDLLAKVVQLLGTGSTRQLEVGQQQLEENLNTALAEIKKLTNAPIYLADIYNPFYPKKWQHRKAEPWVQKYNEAIYKVAWKHGAKVAPVYETFLGHELKRKVSFIGNDGIHPNDLGYAAISEAFWRITKNDLPKKIN